MPCIDDARKAGQCQAVAGTLYGLARTLYNSAHNDAEQSKEESIMVARKVNDPVSQLHALIAEQNKAMASILAQYVAANEQSATRAKGKPSGTIKPSDNIAWSRVGEYVVLAVNVNPHSVAPVYQQGARVFAKMRKVNGSPEYGTLHTPGAYVSLTVGAPNGEPQTDTAHKTTPEKLAALLLGMPVAAIAELVAVWRNDHTIEDTED
jgi:hypothetical protein